VTPFLDYAGPAPVDRERLESIVSVWDHRPTADEILEKRLEGGWRPTPSRLRDGDAVEGHAACVFRPPGPG